MKRNNSSILNFFSKKKGVGSNSTITSEGSEAIENDNTDNQQVTQQSSLECLDSSSMHVVNDIALFINRSLSDNEKNVVLTSLWVPPNTYNFPLLEINKKRGLKFQHKWLQSFSWLCYSEKFNGAFCKYCVLFASRGGIGSQPLGLFVIKPFQNWKKSIEMFSNHSTLEYHKTSILKADHFLSIFLKNKPSIIDQLDDDRIKQKKLNRLKLTPIIDCIVLCGRQEIALRGHRDSGSINFNGEPHDNNTNLNEGNFRAILKYKAKDLDYMKEHLESDFRYKYISPKIQNEIISISGDIILKEIVKLVNKAECFSILADETTDVSLNEQLTLCVRYIKGDGDGVEIHESFLKYVEIRSLTGNDVACAILEGLKSCGIDCSKMYGQGYDGAANMSGKFKGVQTVIRNVYPRALYVHCAAHSLNLAVSSSCELQSVRNCLGLLQKMHCFFNTPKRNNVLLEVIANSDLTPSAKSLKQLCATRWVERYTAVNDFIELFTCVVDALDEISCTFNDIFSTTDAGILKRAIDSEFIIALQVVKVMFSYGLPLCKYLQKSNIDLKEAVELAESNISVLEEFRINIKKEFELMFKEAEKMALVLDMNITVKRLNKRQKNRANPFSDVDSVSPEDYYRITIAIPYIESFIGNLKERFLVHKNIFEGFQCLFSNQIEHESFEKLVKFYLDTDVHIVIAELRIWQSKLRKIDKFPKTAIDVLRVCNFEIFPNIYQLLKILCTLPVSTSTPERTFSCLKRLKTYLRNTMTEDRLNGLTLLAIHKDVPVDSEKVLDVMSEKSRKIDILI